MPSSSANAALRISDAALQKQFGGSRASASTPRSALSAMSRRVLSGGNSDRSSACAESPHCGAERESSAWRTTCLGPELSRPESE